MQTRWNRCDDCGKFISFDDIQNGLAKRELEYPDSYLTKETYITLCRYCND